MTKRRPQPNRKANPPTPVRITAPLPAETPLPLATEAHVDELLENETATSAAPQRKRGTMRLVGNALILVGVLLMLGVGGFQGYIWWQETTTPDVQELQGYPTQVYKQPVSDLPSTPTVVASNNTQASSTPILDLGGGSSKSGTGNVMTGPPVRIAIPSVKIDSKVIEIGWHKGVDKKTKTEIAIWDVAEFAAGHHQGSANLGQSGNIVLSGHDDYKGEVFRYLPDAKPGDEVRLYDEQGAEYLYTIVRTVKVKEEGVPLEDRIRNAEYMNPTPDQTLTLITCWPYAVDNYRWITIAKPASTLNMASNGGPQVK